MTDTPAVLYAAKSTEDVRKSIPDQLRDGRAMVEREGWRVVGEFSDEGFSAYSGNRGPGLDDAKRAAAEAAAEGRPAMLVAQHSDRFARGAGDAPGVADSLVEIWHAMRRQNVHLRTVQNDPMMGDALLVAAAAKMSHEESKRKSEATAAGMRRRAERCLHAGGRRQFGYRYVDGRYVIDSAEAAIVREMFDRFNGGDLLRAIARDLHARGVPTPGGGRWIQRRVAERIASRRYKGCPDQSCRKDHPPIVDETTWERANALLRANRDAKGEGRGRRPNRHLLDRGLGRCLLCGSALYPKRDSRTGHETYRCSARSEGGDDCDARPIPRDALDGAIVSYFREHIWDEAATRREFEAERERVRLGATARREGAEAALAKARERLERQRERWRDDEIGTDEWRAERAELEPKVSDAAAAVEAARRDEAAHGGDAPAVFEDWAAIRRAVAASIGEPDGREAVRAALRRVFSSFGVGPVRLAPEFREMFGDDDAIIAATEGAEWVVVPEPRPEAMAAVEALDAEPPPHPERVPFVPAGMDASGS